jgi:hypothetical protein
MAHNNNPTPGSFAIIKASHKVVSLLDAIRGELYECPKCEQDVIFRHGEKNRPHFCHKNRTDCSNYATESDIHMEAKSLLEKLLESRKINLNISRTCKKCNNNFLCEYGKLFETSRVIQELPFTYKNSNRRADLASIDSDNQIECIFEICHTNKTDKEKRPEPWFEFDAIDLCDKLQNLPEGIDTIELPCIREGFTKEEESRGFCVDCELEIEESKKGKIYFNQRGAGCGKTYESIQLINGDIRFIDKTTYIYLTKMRSAKDVIYGEFENQFKRGALPNFKILQKENCGNQYLILLEKPDKTLIKIIIGTIDSFTYAIRDKNRILSGSDCFQKLVKDIKGGSMSIGPDGSIRYASTTAKLTKDTLVIIDEGQDLEKEYIEAFVKIIDRTGIDTYIIGDKLQSILSEKNLFTHLENTDESRIIKNTGKNVIKRCHNIQFQGIINGTVSFGLYNLPPIEGICSNPNCGYVHEDTIKPYTVDTGFKNIFKISPEEIEDCIEHILRDMKIKIQKHGYLPNNFMFIFPIVNERNKLLAMLYPAIQQFWIEIFMNPESYTDLIMENMRKANEESGYWTSKIENKENDPKYYQFVFWHRSETNQPINLNESANSTKMLSIHASKGNGCECVYLLGLSEFTLACHTGGISNTLVYESLFHVGITRQKKYLFVGIDGDAKDDICRRFGSYYENTGVIEPYIKNINGRISMKYMVADLTKDPFFDKIQENIFDYDENRSNILPRGDQKELVDWGHHIFRFCTMKVNVDKYLWNIKTPHQIAKVLSLINSKETKIVYSDYNKYKKDIKTLYETIKHNIENSNNNSKKCITVPILVFYDERSKTDYARYRKIIKSVCDRVLEKLNPKKNEACFDFCPIESLIYCHLMELIQHPYNITISIMDIYRIISCYDDCYKFSVDHEEYYKCKCNEHFCNTNTSFVNPHKEIQKSIMTHHESIMRIKNIIEVYHSQIRDITGGEQLEYNIDKSIIHYNRGEFSFNQVFNYIGYSKNYVVFMILTPQFNTMNYYEILTKLIIYYFFLQQSDEKDYSKKKTYASIITLDSNEPITIDLTDLFFDNLENIKLLLRDYLFLHFEKEHTKMYNFFNYHSGKKTELKINDKTDLAYVCDILKKTEKKIIDNKVFDKRIYPIPGYITDCFTEMDKSTIKDKKKRKDFKSDPEKYILEELKECLKYTINKYLGISHIETDDEEDEDIENES